LADIGEYSYSNEYNERLLKFANLDKNRFIVENYNKGNSLITDNLESEIDYTEGNVYKKVSAGDLNMYVKSIIVDFTYIDYLENVSFYKKGDKIGEDTPFFIATRENYSYNPETPTVKEYYAVMGDVLRYTGDNKSLLGVQYNGYSRIVTWRTSWQIETDELKEIIPDDSIKNIKSITRYQGSVYGIASSLLTRYKNFMNFIIENTDQDEYGGGRLNRVYLKSADKESLKFEYNLLDSETLTNANIDGKYETGSAIYTARSSIEFLEDKKYSYMEMNALDYDDNFSNDLYNTKRVILSMYKNSSIIKSSDTFVKNDNPVFYVKLNDVFEYKDFNVSITNNPYIYIEKNEIITKDGQKYLKISCKGVYDTSINSNRIDITIDFKRKIVKNDGPTSNTLQAFMLTKNERYYTFNNNSNNLEYMGQTPYKLFYAFKNFEISRTSSLQCLTNISSRGLWFLPNSSDNRDSYAEKNKPIIIKNNGTVKYSQNVINKSKYLNNVSLLYKLPVSGNKQIKTNDLLLEDEFALPEQFSTYYATKIGDSNNANGTVKHLSRLNDLRNFELKINNRLLDSSKYTILYSNDINAGFDSEFIEYQKDISDVSNASVIKVVLNENIRAGENIDFFFDMTMPEEKGMIGAVSGVRYTDPITSETIVLDSEATYVINGEDNAQLTIQKVFEGLGIGEVRNGESLAGIEFKLKDSNGEFVKDNGNDLIATTDSTGKAVINNLIPGMYQIIEITEMENYSGIGNLNYVYLEPSQSITYEVINYVKKGDLNIQKLWEDTNDVQGPVTFRLTRTSNDNINYSVYITTDSEGKARIIGIPYGTYELVETTGLSGWGKVTQTIQINEQELNVDLTNPIGKASIEIIKTVPAGETVDGLKFNIKGLGLLSYTNKQGELVSHNTDMEVTIGQDYSAIPNINVVISEDNLSATITISELPLGLYTIEEIDIAKINGTEIDRFVPVKKVESVSEDGSNYKIVIANKKKTGILEIKKTAYLQDGENRLEIGDLSAFKVKVEGTSYYGNNVERTISLDQDGNAAVALEIGEYTITEVSAEGYDVYYNVNGQLVNSLLGTTVEIKYNETSKSAETTTQEITNVHTGLGYVKVAKTLEGITDPQKVIDAKIRFRVVGKNVAGGNVNEEILIDQIDTQNNVAYGVSGPISTGGDYQLEEIEGTVPDYFEAAEPVAVNLTTANTLESPLVIDVENKRTKGNLEIFTQTNPQGGPLTGITYRVTEVEINTDGTYTKLDGGLDKQGNPTQDTRRELAGDNGTVNPSFAELKQINSGNYLVEQLTIPDGYEKDVNQVVEVPSYGIGYAVFEINQRPENLNTKLIINKEIINSSGTTATAQDFEQAKLNENESFEVKITNVNTREVYYTFISNAQKGIVVGLEPGLYEIEESYKPKYNTEGYYRKVGGIALNEITSNQSGKYIVEIVDSGAGNPPSELELTIRNEINTEFKFGGQDLIDNYSKVDVEEQKLEVITKAVVYVVDENGDEIPNAKFKLLNSEGQQIVLGTVGAELTTNNKKIIINGLPEGTYTLVNTSVPAGYLLANDKQLIVYKDVVRIARIEIQKNIPRGEVTLSTVYVDNYGETKYVPRSKYKVVDKATGELVKFTKTLTGDYTTSKLPDATTEVTLKSGVVELKNLPVGTYEVGLVDVTAGFGMQKDVPETVEIAQNAVENISLQMTKKSIVKISMGNDNTIILNESGELWIIGSNDYGEYGGLTDYNLGYNTNYQIVPYKIEFHMNTKIIDFEVSGKHALALDNNGKVWTWGNAGKELGIGINNNQITQFPICVSEIENNPLKVLYDKGVIIKQVSGGIPFNSIGSSYALDSEGKMWSWGTNLGDGTNNESSVPVCISDIDNHPFKKLYEDGIELVQISTSSDTSKKVGVLDSLGRVWIFGSVYIGDGSSSSSSLPICISDKSNDFNGVKIESLSVGHSSVAIDTEGNAWTWGVNSQGELGIGNTQHSAVPIKLPKESFGGYKIKKVKSGNYYSIYFIDEIGRLWGTGSNYACAQMGESINSTPICISDTSIISGKNIVDIGVSEDYTGTILLDSSGKLWGFGVDHDRGGLGARYNGKDGIEQIDFGYSKNLEYNLRFEEVYDEEAIFAIDQKRRLWSAGNEEINGQGHYSIRETDFKLVPGLENEKIKDAAFSKGYANKYIVTESGKIFFIGDNNDYWNDEHFGIYDSYKFYDITKHFELEDEVHIVNIETSIGESRDEFVALDSIGRLWINTTCISKNPNNPLYNIKLVNIKYSFTKIYAIDNEGKIWYIENNSDPVCLSDDVYNNLNLAYHRGTRFVDIQMSYNGYLTIALDNNGKIWILEGHVLEYSINNKNPYCITDSNIIKYKDKKIKRIWVCDMNTFAVEDEFGNFITNRSLEFNVPQNITYFSGGYYWIDQFGQIWYKNERIFSEGNNPIYNKKVSHIIADGYVELDTDEFEIYAVNRSGISKTIMYGEKYLTNHLNISLVQVISQFKNTNYKSNWSDTSNLPSATVSKSFYAAVDENGKIWTWGSDDYGILGNGANSSFQSIPVCISDITGTELNNAYLNNPEFKIVKMAKVSSNLGGTIDYSFFALDNTGKIWNWGYNIYDRGYSSPVCISNINYCSIYGKTIVELNETNNTVKDSLGNVYGYANLKFRADQRNHVFIIETPSQGSTEVFEPTGALVGKTIVQNTDNMAIDSEGNLYGRRLFDGYYRKYNNEFVNITNQQFYRDSFVPNNNVLINNPKNNILFGTRFSEIYNDKILKDINNKYWFFPETGDQINISEKVVIEESPLYGKTIKDTIISGKYVIASDNKIYRIDLGKPVYIMDNLPDNIEFKDIQYKFDNDNMLYYIGLDINGKVWACGNGNFGQLGNGSLVNTTTPICISDIAGTELANEYINNSSFKIENLYVKSNVYKNGYSIICLDSNGKVWSWGYNFDGQLGNGTTMYSSTPICITNIANTDFNNAYVNNSSKIESISLYENTNTSYSNSVSIAALDSNGKIWTWGSNINGNLATGDKENKNSPICVSDLSTEIVNNGGTFKIKKIDITSNVLVALGNDGKVYTAGSVWTSGNILGKTAQELTLMSVNGVTGIQDYKINETTSGFINYMIAFGENTVWAWGNETFINEIPQNISTSISGINKNESSWSTSFMLDSQGKLYVIGAANNKMLGYTSTTSVSTPEDITANSTLPIYEKNITDIIMNNYIINNSTYAGKVIGKYILAVDSDGVIYEWGDYITSMQVCTKFDSITQSIFGNTSATNKLLIANQLLKNNCTDLGNNNAITTISANNKKWNVIYNRTTYEIISVEELNLAPVYQNLLQRKDITAVLDSTHIELSDGKVYAISETGVLTEVTNYEPSNEVPEYPNIEIPGVNIVDNTNYKALDDQGNLYVWGPSSGGYPNIGEDVANAINSTAREYIVDPIYSVTNGWTVIKSNY